MEESMKNCQERNVKIRQMSEAGDSIREIARALELWEESVEDIVREFETEEAISLRSSRLLENIRKADDPDKRWKVGYIIQALRFKTITQNALIHHFEQANTPEISLRELMDLAISEEIHRKPGYLITHLLDICCIGMEGFWSVVRGLTESDLGERCNKE
jgi:DNA-binding transcriptional MerR regulator